MIDLVEKLFPYAIVVMMVGLLATCIVAAVLLVRLGREMRSTDMARLAARLGLVYVGEDQAWQSRLPDFGHLTRGVRGKSRNLMRGEREGVSIAVHDTVLGAVGRPFHKPGVVERQITVACLEIPALALPRFLLVPTSRGVARGKADNALTALAWHGQPLGALDVAFASDEKLQPGGVVDGLAFPSHPAFQENYSLRVDDEALARRFFTPPVLEHLLRSPGWIVEGGGSWLVVGRSPFLAAENDEQGRLRPHQVENLALGAARLAHLFLAESTA